MCIGTNKEKVEKAAEVAATVGAAAVVVNNPKVGAAVKTVKELKELGDELLSGTEGKPKE